MIRIYPWRSFPPYWPPLSINHVGRVRIDYSASTALSRTHLPADRIVITSSSGLDSMAGDESSRPAQKVVRKLGVSLGRVYFAKYKVSALLKKEIGRLRRRPV
jgi:hypothetical protein